MEALAGIRAAERLYRHWRPAEIENIHSLAGAAGALDRLAQLMRDAPEAEKASRRGADRGAESLTARPFQGLLEQLQNADDLGATELRIAIADGNLLLVHNGEGVRLAHVVAMLMPWLTTKEHDPTASGRFGIGQRTLGALGGPIQVHCDPFHFSIESEGPEPCGPFSAIDGFYDPAIPETLLVVPLFATVDQGRLVKFVRQLGTRTLIFLRSVRRLTFANLEAKRAIIDYRLEAGTAQALRVKIGKDTLDADRLTLTDPDSRRRFVRYFLNRPLHGDDRRHYKATGTATPLGLALHEAHELLGGLYDRLPLPIQSGLPFSLNAQFDPDTARTTLLQNRWNEHRMSDLGDLAAAVTLDRFAANSADGWWAVPMLGEVPESADEWVAECVRELIVKRSQASIADNLRVPTATGESRPLSDLVYEELPLDGLLTPEDQAFLSPGHCALPPMGRDGEGRWRDVIIELGQSHSITVANSLAIFDRTDEELGEREPTWYIRIAKAAIDADLIEEFLWKRGILLDDGRRAEPPGHADPQALVCRMDPKGLAARLGLALQLHPAYLADDEECHAVILALKESSVLLEDVDTADAALDVLAREGMKEKVRLSDSQLIALRNAFEHLEDDQQRTLGPRIGRNVELRGKRFGSHGEFEEISVSPASAYLPATIDRDTDSFANAANRTPNLSWLDPSYARTLKRVGGRTKVGAQRFLARLGAATAPRLTRAEGQVQPYQRDPRLVSPLIATERSAIQSMEIAALPPPRVTHLLEDEWSPDLDAVVRDIQTDRNAVRRRRRALALLGVLARSWERVYAEHQRAKAVWGYNGYWNEGGQVIATWLARLASDPWLPNAKGRLMPPSELYLPTEMNRLAYGNDRGLFLANVPEQVLRSPALLALRLKAGPSANSLVLRLTDLRNGPQEAVDEVEVRTAYRLLALKCPAPDVRAQLVDDLSVTELRAAFSGSGAGRGLLLIDGQWYAPKTCSPVPGSSDRGVLSCLHLHHSNRFGARLRSRFPKHATVLRSCANLAEIPSLPKTGVSFSRR